MVSYYLAKIRETFDISLPLERHFHIENGWCLHLRPSRMALRSSLDYQNTFCFFMFTLNKMCFDNHATFIIKFLHVLPLNDQILKKLLQEHLENGLNKLDYVVTISKPSTIPKSSTPQFFSQAFAFLNQSKDAYSIGYAILCLK